MKTNIYIKTIISSIVMAGAVPVNAAMIYQQNFDNIGQAALISPGADSQTTLSTILPGWSVKVNNALQTNVTIGNDTVGGYAVAAYLATGDGSDFNLSLYNTGAGAVDQMSYTFANTGATALSGIIGSFDFESAWSRYTSSTARNAGFSNGLSYSINGGTAVAIASTATNVNNSTVFGATTWLTDSEMDGANMSVRNIGFSLGASVLNPGDAVTLLWDKSIYSGATWKNMAAGIDNFKLGDNYDLTISAVPEPTTVITTGLALLVVGVTSRNRRMMIGGSRV